MDEYPPNPWRCDSSPVIALEMNVGADLLNLYNNKNVFYFDRRTGERVNMIAFYPSATLTIQY